MVNFSNINWFNFIWLIMIDLNDTLTLIKFNKMNDLEKTFYLKKNKFKYNGFIYQWNEEKDAFYKKEENNE